MFSAQISSGGAPSQLKHWKLYVVCWCMAVYVWEVRIQSICGVGFQLIVYSEVERMLQWTVRCVKCPV